MFCIIWFNDNNMKIKNDSLKLKQFIFVACVLEKAIKLQNLEAVCKDTREYASFMQ